jgi:hypothetical protein
VSTLDLSELLAVARAATPGPWEVFDALRPGIEAFSRDENGQLTMSFSVVVYGDKSDPTDEVGVQRPEDATYIATFNPSVVIKLLEEMGRLRELQDEAYDLFDEWTAYGSNARSDAEQLLLRTHDWFDARRTSDSIGNDDDLSVTSPGEQSQIDEVRELLGYFAGPSVLHTTSVEDEDGRCDVCQEEWPCIDERVRVALGAEREGSEDG